jgi:hypothetical protein
MTRICAATSSDPLPATPGAIGETARRLRPRVRSDCTEVMHAGNVPCTMAPTRGGALWRPPSRVAVRPRNQSGKEIVLADCSSASAPVINSIMAVISEPISSSLLSTPKAWA